MNDGPASFRLGLRGMKASAEASVVERDVQLAQQFAGARLHVAHLSTADALKAVRRGKRSKSHVTCEVTPHHFTLTDADVGEYDANFKMNPPLRSASDREALLVALADGTVDAIATDHAPHEPALKDVEFDRAPFGILGFETAIALTLEQLVQTRKISLARMVELFTTGPARVLGMERKVAAGQPADVTIFSTTHEWTYNVNDSPSKSRNSPFDGRTFKGAPMATIVAGRIKYRRQ